MILNGKVLTGMLSAETLFVTLTFEPFLSFPLLWGDCGRRGWYDCHTVGAEAFVQCSPMCLLPHMYAN